MLSIKYYPIMFHVIQATGFRKVSTTKVYKGIHILSPLWSTLPTHSNLFHCSQLILTHMSCAHFVFSPKHSCRVADHVPDTEGHLTARFFERLASKFLDLRFTRRWLWRMVYSGMQCCVVQQKFANVSKKSTASIFRFEEWAQKEPASIFCWNTEI